MNRSNKTETILQAGNLFNLALLLFTILPLIALSLYNNPSAADDYCFIYTVNVHGWFGGMAKYYNEWSGRYFTVFLNHTNPLLFNSFTGFKLVSIFLVLALAGSIYYFLRTLLPTFSRLSHLGFTGVLMFLFLLKLASIPEAFYWFASFVTYTTPSAMILLWAAFTIQWYREDEKKKRKWLSFLCCLLVFCIIGASETTLLLMVVLIGAWLFQRALIQKKLDNLMVVVTITAILSCFFLFTAPGNTARLGGNPVSGNIPLSVLATFKFLAKSVKHWLLSTPVLLFTLCWIVLLSKLPKNLLKEFSFPLWLGILSFVGILSAIIFPSFYAISTDLDPTPRVINSLYLFFLLGWFYLAGAFCYQLLKPGSLETLRNPSWLAAIFLLCAVSTGASTLKAKNFKSMYGDLISGRAAAYEQEMQERYAILRDPSNPNPVISPIRTQPVSLFVEDIKEDPKAWWNWCMAGYWGKETITLKKETE